MCQLCDAKQTIWNGRRAFLLAAGAAAAPPVLAQVDVGQSSRLRSLVPANELEVAAAQQYGQLLEQARAKHALAPESHPQLQRLRKIASNLIADTPRWNERARSWKWEVNLIGSQSINAFCMPGGKIAFFTGILDKLQLSDDEVAMVMGHEMAHALREHARERIAKSQGTGALLSLGAALFGLGQLGDLAANVGTQLLTLKFSRDDEVEADLVGLEMGARAGYNPEAAVSLWQKMERAGGGANGGFLSTHPSGSDRINRLEQNVPRVRGLYQQAVARR
ncbi:M48 family metallopeptidase [Ramlibacter sp. XY19]|uniref:M48 family metallopeptidase n=1 Tax=Ramlibacter paludis TaxID=2908000 RepID=UPI0023DA30AB|nr:M48 family metallopeptidase [Ramlibacter paludis]MCG2595655.1 M48 family metallopeptidase [Ramlibacter paludis]